MMFFFFLFSRFFKNSYVKNSGGSGSIDGQGLHVARPGDLRFGTFEWHVGRQTFEPQPGLGAFDQNILSRI